MSKQLITRNNELFYLSTQPLTYDEAKNMCQSQGGIVVRISETDKGFIYTYFNETFLEGTSIVFIFFFISLS